MDSKYIDILTGYGFYECAKCNCGGGPTITFCNKDYPQVRIKVKTKISAFFLYKLEYNVASGYLPTLEQTLIQHEIKKPFQPQPLS